MEEGFCHGDYWIGNIIYSEDGAYDVVGVVDWDRYNPKMPLFYDEMHLDICSNAIQKGNTVGEEIISILKKHNDKWSDIIVYWMLFVINSIDDDNDLLNNRRWINKNIINVILFINDAVL